MENWRNFITEACWDGYKQVGMKKKGKRTVPNCVPVEEFKIPPMPGEKEDPRTGNAVGYMGVVNVLKYEWPKKNGQATLEFAEDLGSLAVGGTLKIINPAKGEVDTLYNLALKFKTEPKLKASRVKISKSENPPKLILEEDNSDLKIKSP